MAKKAFLVTFHPCTRIVMDIEGEELSDEEFAELSHMARVKMAQDLESYLYGDNAEIDEDDEIFYDPEKDE
jgi:hypothetical protein